MVSPTLVFFFSILRVEFQWATREPVVPDQEKKVNEEIGKVDRDKVK